MPEQNGVITVSSVHNYKKVQLANSDTERLIEVALMNPEAPIARVRQSRGLTINMGNFESARIDVSVELPTYIEEIPEALERAKNLCEAEMKTEVEALKK